MKSFEPVVSNLPYNLPNTVSGQLTALSKKMNIPARITQGLGQKGINILCGIVIYRHLKPHQKQDVMMMIHDTKSPEIIGFLTTKITDTLVQPDWGLWSRSTSELMEAKEYYQFISKYGSYIGASVSVAGFKDLMGIIWRDRKVTRGGILTVAIWVGLIWNEAILTDIKNELNDRTQFIKNKPY